MAQRGPRIHPGILYRIAANFRPARGLPPIGQTSKKGRPHSHARREQSRQGLRARGLQGGGRRARATVRLRVYRDLGENGPKRGTGIYEPRPRITTNEKPRARSCTKPRREAEREGEEEVHYLVGSGTFFLDSLFTSFDDTSPLFPTSTYLLCTPSMSISPAPSSHLLHLMFLPMIRKLCSHHALSYK